jgi:DNA polymerase
MMADRVYVDILAQSDIRDDRNPHRRAMDLSTRLLSMAYAVDDGPVKIWRCGEPWPAFAVDVTFCAQGAAAEIALWNHVAVRDHGAPPTSPRRWICIAAKAARAGLPRDLGAAAKAVGLTAPRSDLLLATNLDDPDRLSRATMARMGVVEAERRLDRYLPDNAAEDAVWTVDYAINARGFLIDRPFAKAAAAQVADLQTRLQAEATALGLENLNSTPQIKSFFHGASLPDLRKSTVSAALEEPNLPLAVRKVLELRQRSASNAVLKYRSAIEHAGADDRVRDGYLYAGAHTWRWAGQGVQPQNLHRGTLSESCTHAAVAALTAGEIDLAEDLTGKTGFDLLAAVVRGMVMAPPGKVLIDGDYAKIEVVALANVAKLPALVEALKTDVYKEQAAHTFKAAVEAVTPQQRAVGKVAVLGLAYGMGPERFRDNCSDAGVDISQEEALRVVDAFRYDFPGVRPFWNFLEDGVRQALKEPNVAVRGGQYPGFSFIHDKRDHPIVAGAKIDFLIIGIPSGRHLFYPKPRFEKGCHPIDGSETEDIIFTTAKPDKKQKGKDKFKGKLYAGRICENVCQALSRDILAHALVQLENAGLPVIAHSHDEALAETTPDRADEFKRIMETPPPWARKWRLQIETFQSERYLKS